MTTTEHSLRKTTPKNIAGYLEREGIPDSDILLLTDSDIDRLGNQAVRWVAVTASIIMVLTDDPEPVLLRTIEIGKTSEYRCQNVVGSGLLQARVGDIFVDIVRYSNSVADKFHKTANKLHRFLEGEPIVIHEEDETDERRCPTCGLMLSFVGDTCPRCVNKGAVFFRMLKLLVAYKFQAVLIMTLLVVGIALDLTVPQLTRYLVDNVLGGSDNPSPFFLPAMEDNPLLVLFSIVVTLAIVQVLRSVVNITNGRLGNQIGTAITHDFRSRLVAHLQQLSVSYYDQQQVGSLVGRVAYDTEALHGFVSQLTGGFLFQLIMVVGVGIMMFSINVRLAFFTLIPAPLVITGSFIFWRVIYPRYYRFWDASSKQAGMLTGILSGIRVVKAFSQENQEVERFSQASTHLRDTRRGVDKSAATFNPIMAIIFQFGGWIVWYVGGQQVLGEYISLGSLIAYLSYLAMFYGPLTTLTQFTNWLTQFSTQAHRIFEILDTPQEITETEKPVQLESFKSSIVFDDVTFGYNRNNPVIRNLHLEIKFGEMLGVVGRSGSGKTTIINLLSRFYDVNEGRVLIDGIDVRKLSKNDLRKTVGVVLQEPFLFRGTIWRNLVYGSPEAPVEDVIRAGKAANAHDFIMQKPQGYDFWVGERGAGLSGGERQRIGIARVLLIDPKILILDEATSSVDPESEASIQAALAEVVKGRTTIAIAHRLSTLRHADRIVVVDNGTIAESGTHESLIEADGLYAHLVRIQGQMTMPSVDSLATREKTEVEDEDRIPWTPDSPFTSPRSHHIRWLEPDMCRIFEDDLGTVHAEIRGEGTYSGTFTLRCLPVHFPDHYISLRILSRRKREIEVGIIRDLSVWPEEAKELLRLSLLKRYLVYNILSIHEITSYTSYLELKVITEQGPKTLMMRWQGDKAYDYGINGKMLIDAEDNRYLIPDLDKLPDKDRKLFLRYIYW